MAGELHLGMSDGTTASTRDASGFQNDSELQTKQRILFESSKL